MNFLSLSYKVPVLCIALGLRALGLEHPLAELKLEYNQCHFCMQVNYHYINLEAKNQLNQRMAIFYSF